jgi:DNA-binding MarR family transcriptional regulator
VQDLSVLHAIDVGVVYPTDIAVRLNQASPTVSHVISRLVARGLIERARADDDGRKRRLTLTDAGQARSTAAARSSSAAWPAVATS